MNDILSQEEIDMLLRGESDNDTSSDLSPEEIDIIGEIGNISMGTSATTLSTLLDKKVSITAPDVQQTTFEELADEHTIPFVAVEVSYTEGLEGKNLLVIRENDVKIITDLMLGGDGTKTDETLNEMHLSAISEVMNQMVGSSSTSLSTMLQKDISISPPNAFVIQFGDEDSYKHFKSDGSTIVQVKFKMIVEGLIDSYIMQLLPIDFAKDMVQSLLITEETSNDEMPNQEPLEEIEDNLEDLQQQAVQMDGGKPNATSNEHIEETNREAVNVRPVSFQPLEETEASESKENIDILMDIPLQVSVELGRTRKLIKDILELNTGSILELDKMAGEPVDVLVNGKVIAKGEVVVIEDSFGVRINDIISSSKRISNLQ